MSSEPEPTTTPAEPATPQHKPYVPDEASMPEFTLSALILGSILGGLLGILAMIPLRRAFIVRMHGKPGEPGTLLYPEGTACGQVLISGEQGGTSGKTVFIGFGLAFLHKVVTEGMSLLVSTFKL